jgi:maleate isomerase
MKPLTKLVCDYIENEQISVADPASLEISDNITVCKRDRLALVDLFI